MGDLYPDECLGLSLAIDAAINWLDDMYDEELTKEILGRGVLEVVANIGRIADLVRGTPPSVSAAIADYCAKIHCVVAAEALAGSILQAEESSEDDMLQAFCWSNKLRAFAMDIFVQLPLYQLQQGPEDVVLCVKAGRIHRWISLVQKDYRDMQHDAEQGTPTALRFLAERLDNWETKSVAVLRQRFEELSDVPPSGDASSTLYSAFRSDSERMLDQIFSQ